MTAQEAVYNFKGLLERTDYILTRASLMKHGSRVGAAKELGITPKSVGQRVKKWPWLRDFYSPQIKKALSTNIKHKQLRETRLPSFYRI